MNVGLKTSLNKYFKTCHNSHTSFEQLCIWNVIRKKAILWLLYNRRQHTESRWTHHALHIKSKLSYKIAKKPLNLRNDVLKHNIAKMDCLNLTQNNIYHVSLKTGICLSVFHCIIINHSDLLLKSQYFTNEQFYK